MSIPSRDRFLTLLREAVDARSLVKLTLGKARGADSSLRNLFVRPVTLKAGPHFTLVWRHTTRDLTKNVSPSELPDLIASLLGTDFLDAHLFTQTHSAQLECQPDGSARLRLKATPTIENGVQPVPENRAHDQPKHHLISSDAPWLRTLGVTNEAAQPRAEMAGKYRQIQKFAELLQHLLADAFPATETQPLSVVDMGCGKGYLTFAVAELLGERGRVIGVESRPELVATSNAAADRHGLGPRLAFTAGTIASAELPRIDVLIALHACDTATDDALARGLAAGAGLLVVSPCCQKELRSQLTPPPVLADALRHGIFQERQAEFVTDALRAQLLEWSGYRTKVFEFISPDHTAKNLMIAAHRVGVRGALDDARADAIRAFARFYGIRHHALATHLAFPL